MLGRRLQGRFKNSSLLLIMNIFCIGIVKNESDIIRQSLLAASAWATAIYIADNGSDDGTQDILSELDKEHPNINFCGVIDDPFYSSIRTQIYRRFSSLSRPGDWWCRFDADEFFVDDPRAFLAKLPAIVDSVWSDCFQFYFTDVDYEEYLNDPKYFLELDLLSRFRFYKNNWSELRFVKHVDYMFWPEHESWPIAVVSPSRSRIKLKTFQHRNPSQIEQRLVSRLEIARRTGTSFQHVLKSKPGDSQMSAIGADRDMADLPETDYRVVIKNHKSLVSGGEFGLVSDPGFSPSYPWYFMIPSIRLRIILAFIIYFVKSIYRSFVVIFIKPIST